MTHLLFLNNDINMEFFHSKLEHPLSREAATKIMANKPTTKMNLETMASLYGDHFGSIMDAV